MKSSGRRLDKTTDLPHGGGGGGGGGAGGGGSGSIRKELASIEKEKQNNTSLRRGSKRNRT